MGKPKIKYDKVFPPCLSPEIKQLNGKSSKELIQKAKELAQLLDKKLKSTDRP